MDPRWAEVSLKRMAASFGFYHQGNSTQRWVFRQEKVEFYPILVASRCMLVGKVVRKKFAINLKFISFIAWPKKITWWLFQVLFSIYLDYPAPASQSTYHPIKQKTTNPSSGYPTWAESCLSTISRVWPKGPKFLSYMKNKPVSWFLRHSHQECV